MIIKRIAIFCILLMLGAFLIMPVCAEDNDKKETDEMQRQFEDLNHRLDQLEKAVDDLLWYNKVRLQPISKIQQP
jgi:ABC-type transport system involved in cytochrome bd biosynthesis fused ATPase/permease subunit